MPRKRKRSRPRLISLRNLLYLHVVIYVAAILYTWWSFVEIMYATGFIFNEADVPLPLHATWTGILAIHIALTAVLSLLNRWRKARSQEKTLAETETMSDEEKFHMLWEEITELRQTVRSRSDLKPKPAEEPAYRLLEWEDETDAEMILLEEYRAAQEAKSR